MAACGGSDSGTDAAVDAGDIGFNKPTMPMAANAPGSAAGTFTDVGPVDLTCLGSPNTDLATTVQVTLTVDVSDFQHGTPVAGATVTAFPGIDVAAPFGAAGTSNGSGAATVTIPVGTKRFGVKMTQSDSFDTLVLHSLLDPHAPAQTAGVAIVSQSTGTVLPASIGVTRVAGSGVVAGRVLDCQNHTISNFVVALSSTQGTATPIPGADTFYFALSPELPQMHAMLDAANQDGLFVTMQLPVAPMDYVQVWGYATAADLAADKLTLVAESTVPVIADTVVTGNMSPLTQ